MDSCSDWNHDAANSDRHNIQMIHQSDCLTGWRYCAGMDLGEYADAFCANKIDGEMLLDLTESDLMEDFGMTNKYHRRCIMRCITASK